MNISEAQNGARDFLHNEGDKYAKVADDVAKSTSQVMDEVSRKATERMADVTNAVFDTGSKARAQVAKQIEEQPMTAILVAASVGLLAGLLMARR